MDSHIVDGTDTPCVVVNGTLQDSQGHVVRSAGGKEFKVSGPGPCVPISTSRVEDSAGHQLKDDSGGNAKLTTAGILRDAAGTNASTTLGTVMAKTRMVGADGYTNWAG